MALTPCAGCRQPFYASCHDGACAGALCPYCEYGEATVADDTPGYLDAAPAAAAVGPDVAAAPGDGVIVEAAGPSAAR